MVHSAIKEVKPPKADGKYVTSAFIDLTKDYIIKELLVVKQEHEKAFGDMVITLDKSVDGYWRNDVFKSYKNNRKLLKSKSEVNFTEVFEQIDDLISQLKLNFPWKVVEVPRAEADDIILVLAKEFSPHEKILIYSPDKDMIQAQRGTDNVFQYSGMTKKWIVPENKHEGMEQWIQEHVVLGDVSDNVPKVVDGTEFSDNFKEHLITNGFIDVETPMDFKTAECSEVDKVKVLTSFNTYKTNRKGESTGVLDIYKDMRFGPAALKKQIAEFGTLEKWLDSHPLYKKHYDRNFTLVMEEGIPVNIWNEIILSYKTAPSEYNDVALAEYLKANNLNKILAELPSYIKINRSLTLDDLSW